MSFSRKNYWTKKNPRSEYNNKRPKVQFLKKRKTIVEALCNENLNLNFFKILLTIFRHYFLFFTRNRSLPDQTRERNNGSYGIRLRVNDANASGALAIGQSDLITHENCATSVSETTLQSTMK